MTSPATDLLSLITRMMHNGMGERFVRAGLVTGGWKREDVDAAFAERAAQAQAEVPAHMVPPSDGIALTGQNTGADNA